MKVAGITGDGDWIFGRGLASYKTGSAAIAQNVITRLRLFRDDWYLDVDSGVPWLDLLGTSRDIGRLRRAVEATVLMTEGVRAVKRIDIRKEERRKAVVSVEYVDVFGNDGALTETVAV